MPKRFPLPTFVLPALILGGAMVGCGSADSSAPPSNTSVDTTTPVTAAPTTAPPATSQPPSTPTTSGTSTTSSEVPDELAGTSWLLDSTITIGGPQPVATDSGAGLTFNADGTIEINTGCNTGSATVTFDGESSMIVGPVSLTEKDCRDDIDGIEAAMVAVLAEPMTWAAEGGELFLIPTTITDVGLQFVAAP